MKHKQQQQKGTTTMKQTINLQMFREAFIKANRKDQFSYEALEALFNYYEQLEEDTGEQIDLDVVGICCEWTEYSPLSEAMEDLGVDSSIELYELYDVIKLENSCLIQE